MRKAAIRTFSAGWSIWCATAPTAPSRPSTTPIAGIRLLRRGIPARGQPLPALYRPRRRRAARESSRHPLSRAGVWAVRAEFGRRAVTFLDLISPRRHEDTKKKGGKRRRQSFLRPAIFWEKE